MIIGGEGGDQGMVIGAGGMGEDPELPPVDPTCMPTGAEDCFDGVDNDCDGATDCLVLLSQFPPVNGAAAGQHVEYNFRPPRVPGVEFECRALKGVSIPAGTPWEPCASVEDGTVLPISTAISQAEGNDGLWTTNVRLAFAGGGRSVSYRRQVYIHSSLHGETRCPDTAPAPAYFTLAAPNLQSAGKFEPATIRNPFVRLTFTPPVDATWSVGPNDGTINLMSLRRRFELSEDGEFLLVTRNYPSRLGRTGCLAFEKRVHLRGSGSGSFRYQKCQGLVFNLKGAAICVGFDGARVVLAEHVRADGGAQVPAPAYSPLADNFAWRKLRARSWTGFSAHFSAKCDDDACGSDVRLFLPDKLQFPYWSD
jgi:hypothetical protein